MVVVWTVLLISGLLEIVWASLLKRAEGFRYRRWLALGLSIELISVTMLAWTMQELSLGAAYAAWAGIGTVGTIIVGVILYKEKVTLQRFLLLAVLVMGIVGLQFVE